jgi:hypothetical protein
MFKITRYGPRSNVVAAGEFNRLSVGRVWKLITSADLSGSDFDNITRGHRIVRQFGEHTLIVERVER